MDVFPPMPKERESFRMFEIGVCELLLRRLDRRSIERPVECLRKASASVESAWR